MVNEFHLDKSGVPILREEDIELKAEEVIGYFDTSLLKEPQPTPILTFVEKTSVEFKVEFKIMDLGLTEAGRKILGSFRLRPRAIFIDSSVITTARYPFTVAHEFGHLVFHRDIRVTKDGYVSRDTTRDFVTGKKHLTTPGDFLEWHANRFASAILMPRLTIRTALIEAQREIGISNAKLGTVYLDNQLCNQDDFKKLCTKLSKVYGVNKKNIEHRLQDLCYLIDHRHYSTSHISQLLSSD